MTLRPDGEAHAGQIAGKIMPNEYAGSAPGAVSVLVLRGAEDLFQLVRRGYLELIVTAVERLLVRTPAHEDAGVAEAGPLHVVVLDLADALDPQRLPREILARAPAALPSGHPRRLTARVRPVTPGMVLEGAAAQRRELSHELPAHRH